MFSFQIDYEEWRYPFDATLKMGGHLELHNLTVFKKVKIWNIAWFQIQAKDLLYWDPWQSAVNIQISEDILKEELCPEQFEHYHFLRVQSEVGDPGSTGTPTCGLPCLHRFDCRVEYGRRSREQRS